MNFNIRARYSNAWYTIHDPNRQGIPGMWRLFFHMNDMVNIKKAFETMHVTNLQLCLRIPRPISVHSSGNIDRRGW